MDSDQHRFFIRNTDPQILNILLGRLFWDYLDKIEANCGVEEEDESAHINKNILMENKQITKTLSEILKNGDLLPHVS